MDEYLRAYIVTALGGVFDIYPNSISMLSSLLLHSLSLGYLPLEVATMSELPTFIASNVDKSPV